MIKHKHITLTIILCITLFMLIAAKSCVNRDKNRTKSGSSNPSTFTINAPTGLTATVASYTEINLSWTDNSNNEDGFEIERAADGVNYTLIATINTNIDSYLNSDLNPFTTYNYRVRAFNIIGDKSGWSNVADSIINISGIWASVSAGEGHSLALATNGTIWAWGWNLYGQLGINDYTSIIRSLPKSIDNNTDWSMITAGYYHSLAIKTNRTLWSWGYNNDGELGIGNTQFDGFFPVQVGSTSDWSGITGGGFHSIGLKTNGTIWAWGDNNSAPPDNMGQLGLGDTYDRYSPTQIGVDTNWKQVSAGYYHSAGIQNDNSLWVWGSNAIGQLGLGTIGNYMDTPTYVEPDLDWSLVTAGYTRTIVCKNNRTLWIPAFLGGYQQIGTDTDWTAYDEGGEPSSSIYNIALKTNQTLWAWGDNNYGQLGLGDSINRSTPIQLGTYTNWSKITAGGSHNLGLRTNGALYLWGRNQYGQLGLGDTINRNLPSQLGSPTTPSSLISAVISTTQITLSWIDNSNNETGFKLERKISDGGIWTEIATLGINITSYSDITATGFTTNIFYYYRVLAYNNFGDSPYSNELRTEITKKWLMFTGGNLFSMGIKTNGTLWSWGTNSWGQLGLGDSGAGTERKNPTIVDSSLDWMKANCGWYHSSAIKNNGTIWACGRNSNGQLGFGNSISADEMTQVGTQSDWLDCSTGKGETLAIKNNKTLWSWGVNTYGQLGLGDFSNRSTPSLTGTYSGWLKIEARYEFSLGIRTNNTLWSWGRNQYGQLGLGDSTTNRNTPTFVGTDSDWSVISAGGETSGTHSLAIKTNGTIWTCGNNSVGQLGLGNSINRNTFTQIGGDSDWSDVSTGSYHTVAMKTNNTLWVWGDNSYGQLGLGDTLTRNSPIQLNTESNWEKLGAGWHHTFAVKTDDTMWSWGRNDSGQLGLGDTINRNTPALIGD